MLAEFIFCGVSCFTIGFFLGKMSGRGGRKYEEILHEARRDGYMDAIRVYGGDVFTDIPSGEVVLLSTETEAEAKPDWCI